MERTKLYSLLVTIIIVITSSCNYHSYIEKDHNGVKHRLRDYKSYDLQQRYNDKMFIKYWYKPGKYSVDSTCISKTDSLVDCDSIKVIIGPNAKDYASVFTSGLISCKLINNLYDHKNGPRLIDINTGKVIIDTSPKSFWIVDVHPMSYVKTTKKQKFFKLRIEQCWFYFELTNEKAKRKMKMKDFIKGATLTSFFKGNCEI